MLYRHLQISKILIVIVSWLSSILTISAMNIQPIVVGDEKANCYILSDGASKEAIIIDPGASAHEILLSLAKANLRLKAIFLTHAHPDHLGACFDLQDVSQSPVWIHANDIVEASRLQPKVKFRTYPEDGIITIGAINFRIIPIPGHTPGSVCILTENNLFTGDTLFLMSIGKSSDDNALARSIEKNLWNLDDKTLVYPGHGEGTSIGFEKRQNPFVGKPEKAPSLNFSEWTDNYTSASQIAQFRKRPLVLVLTMQQWPCARSYCDALLADTTFTALSQNSVNCCIDLGSQPKFKDKFAVNQIPSVILLDSQGVVLDILEKLPPDVVRMALKDALAGKRALDEFNKLESNLVKSTEDYLAIARYQKDHGYLDKAIFCLEKANKETTGKTPRLQNQLDHELLDAYMNREDGGEEALAVSDRLLGRKASLMESEVVSISLRKATTLYKMKDYTSCINLISELIKQYDSKYDMSSAQLIAGLAYLSQGEYPQALESFRQIRPEADVSCIAKSLYLQGYCYLVQQQYEKACQPFSELVRSYPNSEYAVKAASFLANLSGSK